MFGIFHHVQSIKSRNYGKGSTTPEPDLVLSVDVLGGDPEVFVTGQGLTRVRASVQADGCCEEAMNHYVGIATDR